MTEEEKIICKSFLHDADNTHSCNEYKLLMDLLEQEQFKPMVEIDLDYVIKQKYIEREVLNKIRAEIENDWQLKKYPSSPFSCGLRRAIEIIDKYKAESEKT